MKEILLSLARAAIKSSFLNEKVDTSFAKAYPELQEQGACFVTLTQDGQLRGCIGSIIAHRPLYEDIIHNARSAAFKDPRFIPLGEDDLDKTVIEVSVLTAPQYLEYEDSTDLKKKIKVGIDGVILKQENYQATFLPQVWEELSEFELFFSHLCQKAGLGSGCLDLHPDIYTYQVEKVKEN
jgi:uncharacterized protein